MRVRLKRWLPFVGLAVAAVALWVVYTQVREIDPARLLAELRAYSPWRIAAAIGCVAAAFSIFGLYEAVLLNRIQPSLGFARPFLVSIIVSPIGHSVGLSTLSAGALRYRLYAPLGLSQEQIGLAIVLNTFPFILGLGVLLDAALVLEAETAAQALRIPVAVALALGCIGLLKDVGYLMLTALRKRPLKLGRLALRLPSCRFTLLQLTVGAIDLTCIAAVLYFFMPSELAMGFVGFLIVYIIASVAGGLSTVPAGVGVLEAALLLMLPQVPKEKLLAAVLAYRMVFELLPLLLAFGLLALYELGSRYGVAGRLWRKGSAS